LHTAPKSNSHYAPQPYTNQSVFKSLLNCTSEISLSRNATGREFQRHGPATAKTPVSETRSCTYCGTRQDISLSQWSSTVITSSAGALELDSMLWRLRSQRVIIIIKLWRLYMTPDSFTAQACTLISDPYHRAISQNLSTLEIKGL